MPSPYMEKLVEGWRERVDDARASYISGRMSRDLFTATLFRLGYRGQELTAEANLADHEKLEREQRAKAT